MNHYFKMHLIIMAFGLFVPSHVIGTAIKKSRSAPSNDVELKDAIKQSDFNKVKQLMPSFLTITRKS